MILDEPETLPSAAKVQRPPIAKYSGCCACDARHWCSWVKTSMYLYIEYTGNIVGQLGSLNATMRLWTRSSCFQDLWETLIQLDWNIYWWSYNIYITLTNFVSVLYLTGFHTQNYPFNLCQASRVSINIESDFS